MTRQEITIKQQDSTLPQCIICDIDGTVAINQNRGWYEYDKALDDTFDPRIKYILERAIENGILVIFLTAREAGGKCEEVTRKWIEKYMGEQYIHKLSGLSEKYQVIMRKKNDLRIDEEVKMDAYNELIKPYYNVMFVLEDRKPVVKMWRSIGLLTFQVDETE